MKYTEVTLKIEPVEPFRDLLIDTLGNEGPYDSFVETPDGMKAYIPTDQFDPEWLKGQLAQYADSARIAFSHEEMPDKKSGHKCLLAGVSLLGCFLLIIPPNNPVCVQRLPLLTTESNKETGVIRFELMMWEPKSHALPLG